MDKTTFDRYIKINKKIKSLEKYIDKIKKRSEFVADSVQNGYKRRAVIYGVDYKRKDKIIDLEMQKKILEAKSIIVRTQIEGFIEYLKMNGNLEDIEIANIIQYKYIDKIEWFKIALKMNYTGESIPRMKLERFLTKKTFSLHNTDKKK